MSPWRQNYLTLNSYVIAVYRDSAWKLVLFFCMDTKV